MSENQPSQPTDVAENPGAGLLQRALRSAGSDAAKYIPVRFVPALTSLITVPVFTAAVDTADYGAFTIVSAVASLFSALSTGWIASATVRFYWPWRNKGAVDGFTATVLWAAIVSLVASGVLVVGAALLLRPSIDELIFRLIPVGLAYYFFNFLTNALVQVLRAANRAGAFARMQVGGALLTTVLSIAFVWYGRLGAAGILAGVAAGWAIMLLPIVREISREGSVSPRNVDRDLVSEFLSYGLPLVPVGLATWALVLLDRFVIGTFRGAAEVGLYAVAYSLGEKIMQLATVPLLLTMAPSLTETFERQGQRLAERVQTQFARYFAMVTFPLVIGMLVAAQPFVRLFVAPAYAEAWRVLPIIAAGSMLASFAQIAGIGLGLHKKTRLIMVNTLVAAGFNLAANIALVPRFGYLAAAWNTVASYALLLGITWWQSRKYMRLQLPWAALGRIAVAAGGMGAIVYLALGRLGAEATRAQSAAVLAAEVVLGIVVYVVLMVVVRAVRDDERAFVKEIAGKAVARVRGRR